ncbi:MAG: hypothetical protein U9Q03_01990 [Patescibacteria group bacterium]|nr:hypothetical protein [Patescibacteria group bacterium]
MYLLITIVGLPAKIRDAFVVRFLKKLAAKRHIEIVKSYTTGARRSDRDYEYHVFISKREFLERKRHNEFFRVEQRGDAYYGHRWKDIADVMVDGNGICLFGKLPRNKADQLKKFDWKLMVLNDLPEELMPLGTGNALHDTFFQNPGKKDGEKPN